MKEPEYEVVWHGAKHCFGSKGGLLNGDCYFDGSAWPAFERAMRLLYVPTPCEQQEDEANGQDVEGIRAEGSTPAGDGTDTGGSGPE